ncbi:MAG: family 10 glycosylhydrolase, partial [Armatimonadota bacterium]|nr:family 10 glycosylhydrolase [Armatimonadota bacterium]
GEPAVQDHSLGVISDVVRRYDIDGVHIDDYFYPYKEKDACGELIDFPDETSWQRYVRSGGPLSRDDWRRDNVNIFVERLYRSIKTQKPWVKFGISPFGIWRPGHPPQIQGLDAYAELYADARHWLRNGWADYFAPQLYWKIAAPAQSYPLLLQWWIEQNAQGRHIWPGNFTSRVGSDASPSWPAEEIIDQIEATRAQPGATGNIHFSMKALLRENTGLPRLLAESVYAQPALVPASPWLSNTRPDKPALTVEQADNQFKLSWQPNDAAKVWLWLVQWRAGNVWKTDVLPGGQTSFVWQLSEVVEIVAVSAVDRCGNTGTSAIVAPHGELPY